jgi:hypothetical protein
VLELRSGVALYKRWEDHERREAVGLVCLVSRVAELCPIAAVWFAAGAGEALAQRLEGNWTVGCVDEERTPLAAALSPASRLAPSELPARAGMPDSVAAALRLVAIRPRP